MQIEIRATGVRPWLDVFIHSFPGGGKTGFLLSSYWEKDGKRGGPLVLDFDKGGVDATAANMGLAGKIPVIEPKSEEEVIFAVTYPERIVEMVHATPGFADYEVQVFGFDTVSSMEDLIMGEPKRATTATLPASQGSGLMALGRKRDETHEPAIGDYKALTARTKGFLRMVRAMPYHTICTSHTIRTTTQDSPKGMSVSMEEKEFGCYPNLIGENKYNCAKLHDAFLYMVERGGKFYTYTQNRGGAVARTRFMGRVKPEMENLKFWDLVKIFDSLRVEEKVDNPATT